MEEIKFRLQHENSVIVANICDRLYDTILEKLRKNEKCEEWDLLWHEVKTNKNPLTANSAAKLITKITLENLDILKPQDVLTSFLAAASQAQCPEGICWSIGQILWTFKSEQDFGIAKFQHPFVALLRSSPQIIWPFVACQLQEQIEENPIKV